MSEFRQNIEYLMALVPKGQVTTYGDLASLVGRPRAARMVGGVAHYGNPDLPWHRLVNKSGGLAKGYPGGMKEHQRMLEQDGVVCDNFRVKNFEVLRWRPENL